MVARRHGPTEMEEWRVAGWIVGRRANFAAGRGKRTIGNEVKEGLWNAGEFAGVFEGKWSPDDPYSNGKVRYNGGDVFEGRLYGIACAKRGYMTYANGNKYDGDWDLS